MVSALRETPIGLIKYATDPEQPDPSVTQAAGIQKRGAAAFPGEETE